MAGNTRIQHSQKAGVRSSHLRNHNLSAIARTLLLAPEPLSRAEIAKSTSLNRSTISRLVDHLIEYGIVIEGTTDSTGAGGRPRTPLLGASHTHVAIGAEISSHLINVVLIDLRGETLAQMQRELTLQEFSAKLAFHDLSDLIANLFEQIQASHMTLTGITVGMPGLIKRSTCELISSPNFGWSNIDLQRLFTDELSTKLSSQIDIQELQIRFENSANLSAFNELIEMTRNNVTYEDFLLITGNSGIGSCLIRERMPVEGTQGWAGEFGHVYVADSNKPCTCGACGCLESFASFDSLMQSAGFQNNSTLSHLISSLRRKDKRSTQAIKKVSSLFGRALASYINLVDIQNIVLGGIYNPLYPYMKEDIELELKTRVVSYKNYPPKISLSLSNDNAVASGAAWRAILDFIDFPDSWTQPSTYARSYKRIEETSEVTLPFPLES